MDIKTGIPVQPRLVPPLDPEFVPASLVSRRFRKEALEAGGPVCRIGVEQGNGSVSLFETPVFPEGHAKFAVNLPIIERTVKFLLWQRGGWKVYVGGPAAIGEHIRETYRSGGARAFDSDFMGGIYERPFTVVICSAREVPAERQSTHSLGRHLDGCRVGFDLGGSDRKCAAVKDGEVVFAEEVEWDPYHNPDPSYHYDGVMDSINRAAAHLPRVDAVGGSAAGVYVNNRVRVGSLYRGIARDIFEERVAGMFIRIGEEMGVPLDVVNDGEVSALAGSMSLEDNPVLGLAMGTSVAAGYVNEQGNITTWLNELAFVPVDYRPVNPGDPNAPVDEWSKDLGCGVSYFCQQGTARIARQAGLDLGGGELKEQLKVLQAKMAEDDPVAAQVYESVGIEFGYAVAHYADFYDLKHLLVLGRVSSGKGGDLIVSKAREVLREEFPDLAETVRLALPDEKARRVGQSIAAASLPEIE